METKEEQHVELEIKDEEGQPTTFRTSGIAWIYLVAIIAAYMSSIFAWLTASVAPVTFSEWTNASFTQLNWLTNAFSLTPIVLSLPSAWAYERFGIKPSLIVASCLTAVGCWVRCIAIAVPLHQRFAVLLVGQTIAALGAPFYYNLPPYGLLPSIAASLTSWLLLILAAIATVMVLPFPFLPAKPKHSPSVTADLERQPSAWQSLKLLMKNINFLWLTIAYSFHLGMLFSIGALTVQILIPYGYSVERSALCAAIPLVAGTISGFIPNNFDVVIIAFIANGIFVIALVPAYLEYACEIAYPVAESFTMSIMSMTVGATNVIFVIVLDKFRAGEDALIPGDMHNALVAAAIIVTVGCVPVIWIKGDMKRLAIDNGSIITKL
ncbi:major facilitator superfamily domain-containing protein [Radiomyces spectabilis]|uniref:major facilitator superfamily domain-containing protein n=1 Tax=Radiomyces spectabilis TaxID=64574 RepID=UPI00221ECE68|nr:major facilitator superfamily domain-containing protein [Radiomyces spectabilis]KAI8377847.1 major facilitator superfamily domain-containing protein [Radiomyces spectabilis]